MSSVKSVLCVVAGAIAGSFITLLLASHAAALRDEHLTGHFAAMQMLKAEAARSAADSAGERRTLENALSAVDPGSDLLGTRVFAWHLLTPFVIPALHAAFANEDASRVSRSAVAAQAKSRLAARP